MAVGVDNAGAFISLRNRRQDGFSIEILITINIVYLCSICNKVLRDPVKCQECGIRCCYHCYRNRRPTGCPGSFHDNMNQGPCINDEVFQLELNQLKVQCQVCKVKMCLEQYKTHGSQCPGYLPAHVPLERD